MPLSHERNATRSPVQGELKASTADWLIVVGNDPLWSAGASGPAPGLADKLLPLMNEAVRDTTLPQPASSQPFLTNFAHGQGVSVYIGGRDPLAQHFAPVASAPNVDVIVVGNGAAGNTSMAALLPNLAACPPGSLKFSYGAGAGFATLGFAVPDNSKQAALTVTFYDETGAALYSFSKNATRSGHAAPPPVRGLHGNRSGLLLLICLAVIVAAGIGYFARLATLPIDDDPPERKRRMRAARAEEIKPLSVTTGSRFNTFSL